MTIVFYLLLSPFISLYLLNVQYDYLPLSPKCSIIGLPQCICFYSFYEGGEAVSVFVVNDVDEALEFLAYLAHLAGGVGIEKYLTQQRLVFIEHSLGYGHVALEGGAGCILRLHDGCKDEGADKGYAERVGHYLVVLFKGVLTDVKAELLVEVFKEYAPHIVAVRDNDGVLIAQRTEVGKGGAEHGVGADVGVAALLIVGEEVCLYGGYVAQYAVAGQVRLHLTEDVKGIFERNGVDDEIGLEGVYLIEGCEALGVVHKAQPFGVDVEDCCLMLKAEQVNKE